jgi:hypothetical protein
VCPSQILHVLQLANNFQDFTTAGRQQQQQQETASYSSSSSTGGVHGIAGRAPSAAGAGSSGAASAGASAAAADSVDTDVFLRRAIRLCEPIPNKLVAQTATLLMLLQHLLQHQGAPPAFFSQTFAGLGLQQWTPVCLQQQQQRQQRQQQQQVSSQPQANRQEGQLYQHMQKAMSQRAVGQLIHREQQHRDSNSTSSNAAAAAGSQDSQGGNLHAGDEIDGPSFLLMGVAQRKAAREDLFGDLCEWQKTWLHTATQLRRAAGMVDTADRLRVEQQALQRDMRTATEAAAGKAGTPSDVSSSGEGPKQGTNQGFNQANSSNGGSSGEGDKQQPLECLICAAEAAAAQLLSSSSGSSSSRQAAGAAGGGLYSNLPVSWSDPCLMRRLLWELLGKLKPTAQQWFKQHARMCPHRGNLVLWHMVVMSLARQIWAPPGDWNLQSQQQMLLVLSPLAMERNESIRALAQPGRTAHYARALGFAFERDPDAFGAAVLSMQVLLALDPHGARVQPRPELLFYTPAGFHAAVCKTIVQAALLPAPPTAAPEPAGEGGDAAAAAAAAAAADDDVDSLEGTSSEVRPPHYLQAWSDALLPAWYVWWHIGLLAYHQQQQRQQQRQQQQKQQQTSAVVSPPLSPETPQPLVLPGRQAPLAAAAATANRAVQSQAVAAATQKTQPASKRGSSSSGGGSSAHAPVSLQELYSNPDAR